MRLIKDSSIYAAGSMTALIVGIILVPIYTRIFSPDQYGIIDLIATVSALLTLVFIAGLDGAIARYYIDTGSESEKKTTASTGMFYIAVTSFLTVAILAPFSGVLAQILFNSAEYWLIILIGLMVVPFTVMTSMFNTLLRFRFQPVRYSLLSVGVPLFQTLLTIWLVVILKVGIIGVYIAALAANMIASVIGFILTRGDYILSFSASTLRRMLSFGLPYLLLCLALYVMNYSSRYFLKFYDGLDEVGLYAVGYRIAYVIGVVTVGFELAWHPFVLATYKDEDAGKTFARVFDYASVVICLAVLGLSLFSRELLYIFTTSAYVDAYRVVPFIAASVVTYTIGAYFAVGIALSKKTIHIAWAGIITAAVNIVLSLIVIPWLGMVGAALSSWISYFLLALILLSVSQKLHFIPYRFGRNLLLYLITATIIGVVYLFLMNEMTWLNLLYKVLIIICFISVPFILKLVGRSEVDYLRHLIRQMNKKEWNAPQS
jgi:O-antigen/teichoic acid export membrane protein